MEAEAVNPVYLFVVVTPEVKSRGSREKLETAAATVSAGT
jgi:hypothetical protein